MQCNGFRSICSTITKHRSIYLCAIHYYLCIRWSLREVENKIQATVYSLIQYLQERPIPHIKQTKRKTFGWKKTWPSMSEHGINQRRGEILIYSPLLTLITSWACTAAKHWIPRQAIHNVKCLIDDAELSKKITTISLERDARRQKFKPIYLCNSEIILYT